MTGEPFDPFGFQTDQPDGGTAQNCLGAATDGWFDESCARQMGFICEYDDEFCGDGTINGDEECDDGGTSDGDGCESTCTLTCGSGTGAVAAAVDSESGNCFAVYPQTVDFAGAEQLCNVAGATHLATITTTNEIDLVNGLIDQLPAGGAWIGLTDRDVEGELAWVSGEPRGEDNFAPGEPNDLDGTEDCGLAVASIGWFDVKCSDNLIGAVCEFVSAPGLAAFPAGSAAAILFENLTRHGVLSNERR